VPVAGGLQLGSGRYGVEVPALVGPALSSGVLRGVEQPCLTVDEELVVRPWQPRDAATVREAFAVPDIQHWHMRSIDDSDEALQWINDWQRRWDAELDAGWAVTRADDQVVGQVSLRTIMLFAAQAQLSYWVLPAARGTGVAARATRCVVRWAFDVLGLHRLYVVHSTANPSSCRVALNAGFALEGTLRDYMQHTDGWHDVHMHGLLRTDADCGAGQATAEAAPNP
jgi:ribosomal-protein-alanine N-acetyltransferase